MAAAGPVRAARTTSTRWAPRSDTESQTDLALKAAGYEMPAWPVDGMDVLAVAEAPAAGRRRSPLRRRPHFLELRTYRFRRPLDVRPGAVPRQGRGRRLGRARPDPGAAGACRPTAASPTRTWAALEEEVAAEIEEAVAYAEAGTPSRSRTSPGSSTRAVGPRAVASVKTTYREAMRAAIREALQRDERVFLMGEDVGRYGGCFAVSLGLLEEFGPERIRDTPLSESAFVGAGIGAALGGMRPIVEIMTVNFSLLALDQIVNNAATLLHMSGGQLNVPLVIRMTTGAGRQLAAQHSHSLEGWYAHIPGLRIVAPATLADAAACCGRRCATPTRC